MGDLYQGMEGDDCTVPKEENPPAEEDNEGVGDPDRGGDSGAADGSDSKDVGGYGDGGV